MIAGGVLDVVPMGARKFRFRYITPNGAEYLGPGIHGTKKAAFIAGEKWLNEQPG